MLQVSQQLFEEEQVLSDFQNFYALSDCRAEVDSGSDHSVQVIWTDGACSQNQDHRFRRAGSGVYYGPHHLRNWSGFLPGLAQSNQRAELFAVLVACLIPLNMPEPPDVQQKA